MEVKNTSKHTILNIPHCFPPPSTPHDMKHISLYPPRFFFRGWIPFGLQSAKNEKGKSCQEGKERSLFRNRKAFSRRRLAAAAWFRVFRDSLRGENLLGRIEESDDRSVTEADLTAAKVLAIVRNTGGKGSANGGRGPSPVYGGMLRRGANTR